VTEHEAFAGQEVLARQMPAAVASSRVAGVGFDRATGKRWVDEHGKMC
jgi:hypothetical protein